MGLDKPLRHWEDEAHTISQQIAHEGGKDVSPTHQPPLSPQKIFLVLISFKG
jgi:hypothetical protein